jgi:NADH-quinone oxidoreductase subunit H
MATTLFLGGWMAPWPLSAIADGALNTGWWTILWFLGKTFAFLYVFIWLRGTLPRLRYDQFMRLGWKGLVPLSLLWIVAIFAIRTYRNSGGGDAAALIVTIGIVLTCVLLVAFLVPDRRKPEAPEAEPASDYPVPPLDLAVPEAPRRKSVPAAAREKTDA